MIILIDAYNLLKTVLHVQYISDLQRLQFLQFFEKYAQLRLANQVLLVFDGGPDVYESQDRYQHIQILYAGIMQSADDVIKKKIIDYKAYDILLVTCDRELRRYAVQYQIESLGSVEFYKILQNIVYRQDKQEEVIAQTICKTTHEKNDELDMLMEMGSRKLVMKEQDKEVKVKFHSNDDMQVAKKDKKLLKKILKI